MSRKQAELCWDIGSTNGLETWVLYFLVRRHV